MGSKAWGDGGREMRWNARGRAGDRGNRKGSSGNLVIGGKSCLLLSFCTMFESLITILDSLRARYLYPVQKCSEN